MKDSELVDDFVESLGSKLGKYSVRNKSPHAIVVHNTGYGPIRRYKKGQYATPMGAALAIYSSMMKAGPHYVVDQTGSIVQVCKEKYVAWHVGSRGGQHYLKPRKKWLTRKVRWWRVRWPLLESPRGLAAGLLWDGNSVNDNTIGIEVVPNPDDPYGLWSEACWDALSCLVMDICRRNEIPFARDHIVSHSDAHPRARSRKGIPWDAWPEQWSFDWLNKYVSVQE